MSGGADHRAAATASTPHANTDMRAAFTGLFVGAVALLLLVYGVVKLTSASFEEHAPPGAPAATTPH